MRNIGNPWAGGGRKGRSEIFIKEALAFYTGNAKLVFDNIRKFKNISRTCSHLMVNSSYF